jgi:hypothetical protein
MSTPRGSTQGWRHIADIRFTDIRVRPNGVEMDAVGEAGVPIRFAIDAETLRTISGHPRNTAVADLFEGRREQILGVATRAFNAGVRGEPIRLLATMFPET